jgi:hypothetical protein
MKSCILVIKRINVMQTDAVRYQFPLVINNTFDYRFIELLIKIKLVGTTNNTIRIMNVSSCRFPHLIRLSCITHQALSLFHDN